MNHRWILSSISFLITLFFLPHALLGQSIWAPSTNGAWGGTITTFAFVQGRVLAGSGNGVYRYDSATNEWGSLSPDVVPRILVSAPDGALFAIGESEIRRSTNSGNSWDLLQIKLPIETLTITSTGTLLATKSAPGEGVIFRSDDGGLLWDTITIASGINGRTVLAARRGGDGAIFAATSSGILLSRNDGRTWSATAFPGGAQFIISEPSGSILAATPDGPQRSSDDGATWKILDTLRAESFATHDGRTIYARIDNGPGDASRNGIYRSVDSGKTWSRTVGFLPRAFNVAPAGDIWLATGSTTLHSVDRGDSWTAATRGLTNLRVPQILLDDSNHLYAMIDEVPFRSGDNGVSWESLENAPPVIDLMVAGGAIAGRTLEIVQLPAPITLQRLYVSRDSGNVWTPILADNGIGEIACLENDMVVGHTRILATDAVGGGLLLSRNGAAWSEVGPDKPIVSSLLSPTGAIIASYNYFSSDAGSMSGGIIRSENDGATWSISASNIVTDTLARSPTTGTLFSIGMRIDSAVGNVYHPVVDRGLYVSRDDGRSWGYSLLSDSATILRLWIAPSGHLFVQRWRSSSAEPLLRSTDDGATWQGLNMSGACADMLFTPEGSIYAIFDGRLYSSSDNGSIWQDNHNGIPRNNVQTLALTSDGHILAGTSTDGIFRSDRVSSVAPPDRPGVTGGPNLW